MTQIKIKYFESSDKRLASQPASQPASLILYKIYVVESPCTDSVCPCTGFLRSFALMQKDPKNQGRNQWRIENGKLTIQHDNEPRNCRDVACCVSG